MASNSTTGAGEKTWFGHPPQLARLFTTEMWERFGYYGMRALLALYLAQWFLFDDQTTGGLYGAFTSLVYLTPLFGGLIADRLLGAKRSVKFGAIIMCLGYLGLCFGGEQAKPVFNHAGQSYEVQVSKDAAGKSVQSVVTTAGTYAIKGNDDGSVTLQGSDGSVLPQTIAKGEFKADAERNPFWVSIMLLSLSLVVVGNGFFKPNISTIVGTLYAPGDRRRDAGFTIFYMGINLGSIGSQIFAPLFAQWFGWWAGFGLVAVGMAIAWGLFQFDGGRLKGYGEPPADVGEKSRFYVYLGALAAIPVAWFLLNNAMLSAQAAHAAAGEGTGILGYLAALPLLGKVLFGLFVAAVIGIPVWAARVGTREEFEKMVVAIVLVVMSVVFWTLFELAGSALTLFAERSTDRHIGFGMDMPAGSVQAFNPIFIVLLAPLFAGLWVKLAKRNFEPSIPVKFSFALVLVGLGFLVVVFGAQFADSQFRVGIIWLALLYLLHSIGELCLSPVGLSMITKLSIARIVGMMMGVWFLATSMANYVGGMITQFASVETVGGEVTNPKMALDTYIGVFQTIGLWAIGIGIFLFVISPLLKRWMHGVQ
ncbi:peptide MFS transporter [Sphingomonas sp. LaA6.9]|uniref:peptide MFS transporter n=1 Tax=Sphingomonas sp. LaA6.9 TaxID=2919914 RepID=UPI001F4FA9BF|nr:oligopeptide:H+ symporter [Sphingomonas sp. LaA6.9]MCJ8158406.1 oligopeptide:H+ symporter [Sphingomonas sp. LaA6.9]